MIKNKSWHFLPILIAITSIGYFATDIYMPALPAITQDFGITDNQTQMTLSIYLFSFCFTPLLFGPYSDAAGRKPVIIGGLLLALVATLLCIVSTNLFWLMVARFFQGIGCGAVVTSARAMLPDKFKGAQMTKHTSIIAMSIPVVLAVAPSLGGVLEEYFSWHAIFIFLSFYIVGILLWVIVAGEETLQEKKPFKLSPRIYHELCKNKTFVLYGLMACFVFVGISGYIAISPFLFQNVLGLSAASYGFLSLIIGAAVFLGGLLNIGCASRLHPHYLLLIGVFLQAISGVALVLCEVFKLLTPNTLLVPCTIYFMSSSMVFPNAFSGAFRALAQHYGSASAILSATQLFAGFVAILILSLTPADNAISLGISFIFTAASIGFCLLLLHQRGES